MLWHSATLVRDQLRGSRRHNIHVETALKCTSSVIAPGITLPPASMQSCTFDPLTTHSLGITSGGSVNTYLI